MQSKIAIIMLVCFFAPFINTLSGVVNVDDDKLELFRSMGATKMQMLRKLVLPDAMPVIMAGERLALTAALSGVLVAEFIQRDKGIGSLILVYTRNLNMASAFACIFTLTIVGFAIFRGMECAGPAHRLLEPRRAGAVSAPPRPRLGRGRRAEPWPTSTSP